MKNTKTRGKGGGSI